MAVIRCRSWCKILSGMLLGNVEINEIGRMISGVEITDLTNEHAKELLNLAKKTKIEMLSN